MARPGSGNRERILSKASEMLWTGSYGSISADQICDTVGVNKGVFYHYFKSKRRLVLEAMEYNWSQSNAIAAQILDNTSTEPDPMKRLMKFVETVMRIQRDTLVDKGVVPGCPFGNLAVELSGQDAEISAKVKEIFNRHKNMFKPVLKEIVGNRRGKTDLLALKLLAYLEGIFVMAKAYNDVALPRKLARGIPEFINASIKA
ncbi:MAG: TetR/AcrR family transcriptional regulator [Myxococcota bacterium]|nr:TetR/AcrR family transcriptional regulator [Myxococcota bacterium]